MNTQEPISVTANPNIHELQNEDDLIRYLRLLKAFSERYTILISSYDTPFGPGYPHELSEALAALGTAIDLYGKYRAAYVAVIDSGALLFEEISAGSSVEYSARLGCCDIHIISTGYNSNDWISCMKINQKNHFVKSRGLNFTVFDKITGFVLDSVGFDTYSEGCPCSRPAATAELIRKIQKERSVKIVVCNFPKFPSVNLTANEKALQVNPSSFDALYHFYSAEEVNAVAKQIPRSHYDVNGVRRFFDYRSPLVNTAGGHRVTANQPKTHKKTIYMVGGCRMYGMGSADFHTVESFLQDLFNTNLPDAQVIVQNYGFMFEGLKRNEIPSIIDALPLKPGDLVLTEINVGEPKDTEDICRIDISDAFNAPRQQEVVYDTIHYTPYGNLITAKHLYKEICAQGLLSDSSQRNTMSPTPSMYGFDESTSDELNQYKAILKEYYAEKFAEPVIGSIVMNCNPFTLGHRYLIEKALEQCDFLMVFAVQEDKSIFPFSDRLQLIDAGTADIPNIEVIPSGRFIISSLTFTEYFNKSELQEQTIDTSLDVTVFAREIAPCLHITKRFAGEEPNDSVTRQYNENMARILPEYGIEFIEIPRVKIGTDVISASRVRTLLEQRNFDEIKPLVPPSTYDYLITKFGEI